MGPAPNKKLEKIVHLLECCYDFLLMIEKTAPEPRIVDETLRQYVRSHQIEESITTLADNYGKMPTVKRLLGRIYDISPPYVLSLFPQLAESQLIPPDSN